MTTSGALLAVLALLWLPAAEARATSTLVPPDCRARIDGYRLLGADGGVFAFGDAGFFGRDGTGPESGRRVAIGHHDPSAYWIVTERASGSLVGAEGIRSRFIVSHLSRPIVGLATDAGTGAGWMVGTDGFVIAMPGAGHHGSATGLRLAAPVAGMAPARGGYWLAAADGGVFAFGDAPFLGSMAGRPLAAPVVGIAPTPSGRGYWLAAADGGVFAFGDAPFPGSLAGSPLNAPVVGIAAVPSRTGFWLAAADGGVFAFGDAPFLGSMAGTPLAAPVVDIAPSVAGVACA